MLASGHRRKVIERIGMGTMRRKNERIREKKKEEEREKEIELGVKELERRREKARQLLQ